MNEESSAFGADPEQIDKLLAWPLKEDGEQAPTASLHRFVEGLGSQVGRYKLLSVLGEGGMGIVYLAEQEGQIRRKVALKVIKPGMDSKRVIASFETERQALALLDHPNIAQVYDAGTTESGRPYFVMEYVKGSPITEYCDRHRLSIEDRLTLFQEVCTGLQHAHQKGIIHRDIKPTNILVSAGGDKAIPKIIDFGVAKAIAAPLTERTLFTEDSHLLGTPEYMSPEQADMANEDIDIRSDIYSLGVLLYVLLAGVMPFDSDTLRTGGIEHIRKIIRETDPKTPSTRLTKLGDQARELADSRRIEIAALAKCLHRELEWIPLKAMRKDRSERYRAASEMADDIENYMSGEPLIAGPPGLGYKLRKFVRRNRVLVAGVAAVLVVLIAGVVVSTILAIGQARARAESQLVTNFLRWDVLDAASTIKGREAMVIDILNAAATKLREFAEEDEFRENPITEANIRGTLASTYYKLGYYALGAQQLQFQHKIYLEQYGENDIRTNTALNVTAVFYYHAGRYREAEPLYRQVIKKAYQHKTAAFIEKRLNWNANLGITLAGLGRYGEAEQLLRPRIEANPGSYGLHLGRIYREQGQHEKAERVLLESLDKYRKDMEEGSPIWAFVQPSDCIVRCMHELGLLRLGQDRLQEAEELFKQGMDFGARELPGKDHPFTLRHVNELAIIRIQQQRYEEAKTLLERALEGRRLKLGDDHPNTIKTIHDLGILHREQGQYDEAESLLTEAHKKRQTTLGKNHPHTQESVKTLIDLNEAWNKPEEADKWRTKLPVETDKGK